MPVHPMVAETWPHLGALQDTLERLTSREHVVKVKDDKHRVFSDDEIHDIAEKVRSHFIREIKRHPSGAYIPGIAG